MRLTPAGQKDTIPAIVQTNWALWALGDLTAMRKGVDRGLSIVKAPDLVFQDALLKLQRKDFGSARASLNEILTGSPENLSALDVLARSYVLENQPAAALNVVRQFAAERPKSAALQQLLGTWLMSTGNHVEARTAFEAAKAANPAYAAADFALAQIDLSEGKMDSARRRLMNALSSNDADLNARILLGMVEEVAGRRPAAAEQYRRVLDTEPSNLFALNNLAYVLANSGTQAQADEALKLARRAAEIRPDSPIVQDTIGWTYYQEGLYKNALPYLASAVKSGQAPIRMYHLAMTYYKLGDKTSARQTLDAALKLNPALPEAEDARKLLGEAGAAR